MMTWNQHLERAQHLRRRAYLLVALITVGAQVGLVLRYTHERFWSDLPIPVVGALLCLGFGWAASHPRITMRRLDTVGALLVGIIGIPEFTPFVNRPMVGAEQYLGFILVVTLWLGLLPPRSSLPLVTLSYAAFAALVLTRPQHDLRLLFYLAADLTVTALVISFGKQITAQQNAAADLHRQAHIDALTGLPNRRSVMEMLETLGGVEGETYALFMIDVDHFKAVNDRYTHTVGDQVLTALGPALCARLSPGYTLGRWGGEEFMLFQSASTASRAYDVASQLHGQPLILPSGLPTITVSVGAAFSHEAPDLDALLRLVARRLHAAKASGRNQVKWDEQTPEAEGSASAPA